MESLNETSANRSSVSSFNQNFLTPKESYEKKKPSESLLTNTTSHTSYKVPSYSLASLHINQKNSHKVCSKSLEILNLTNQNIKLSMQNESFRTTITQQEIIIKRLENDIMKLTEESKIRDTTVQKLTDFVIKREAQFSQIFKEENSQFLRLIENKNKEICEAKGTNTVKMNENKRIQTEFEEGDEVREEKDEEILRLQSIIRENKKTFEKEKEELEKRIISLEGELERVEEILLSEENEQLLKYFKEIEKICSEVNSVNDLIAAILSNKSDDNIEFIDSYLTKTDEITCENAHQKLVEVLDNISEIKSKLKQIM